MGVRDDFKKLMDRFKKEVDKKGNVDLLALFKESVILFDKLKDRLNNGTEEEKKEIFEVMAEMHAFLLSETKKLAERTGLTEEQLLRFSENPDNFTPGQWKALETVKDRLNKTAVELSAIIKEGNKKEGKAVSKPVSSSSPAVKRIKKPGSAKKDRWMRS